MLFLLLIIIAILKTSLFKSIVALSKLLKVSLLNIFFTLQFQVLNNAKLLVQTLYYRF